MITRRHFGKALGSLLLSSRLSAFTKETRVRPNVLLVIADEWRAQAFGYTGDRNAETPTFDHFAAQSLDYRQAVSGCSVCCPSRASLLTGQYPLRNGVYINDVPLEPNDTTLGEAFRNAGYHTGYIGKWHLYGSPAGRYERRDAYIPPEKRFGFEYWKAAECTHDYNHSFYYEDDDPTRKYWHGYDAIAQTEDACRFVRDHAHGSKPYFLVLSWGPPHFPLNTAPEMYRTRYSNRAIQLRPNVPKDKQEAATQQLRGYYSHIAALDDCFKRLLQTVEATGTGDDTIVVFTSDHGDMMESQGLIHKLYPWEESIRIPLLIRYPRKFGRSGRRTEALINMPDLMPTLLALGGLPIPADAQGTDYSRVAKGKRAALPTTSAFLNLPVPITSARSCGFAEYRGVRNHQFTYVRSIHGPWLLYDNRSDPYQMHNLRGQPRFQAAQDALEAELQTWLKALNDEFLPAEQYLQRDHLTQYIEPKFPVGYVRSPWGDWNSTLPIPTGRLSVDSRMGELLDNPAARGILTKELPELAKEPILAKWQNPNWRGGSLRMMQIGYTWITDTKLQAIDDALARLPQ